MGNGSMMKGKEWKNSYFSDNNKMFEGEWIKDERNGEGFLADSKEKTLTEGWWRHGKIEGKTTITRLKHLGQIKLLSSKELSLLHR